MKMYESEISEPNAEWLFMASVLEQARQFRLAQPHGTLEELGAWMMHEKSSLGIPTSDLVHEAAQQADTLESRIARYIVYMYRFARGYGKKLLHQHPLSSIDDVPYLLMLLYQGPATKMELIHANLHEKTTGMEIIKRLQKLGFMEQHPDPRDGRQRMMRLTDSGRSLCISLLRDLQDFGMLVNGNLTLTEKHQLMHLLQKLYGFHLRIHEQEKHRDWEGLVAFVKG
jgi:DNA-binding MarR family transcriptional regulator